MNMIGQPNDYVTLQRKTSIRFVRYGGWDLTSVSPVKSRGKSRYSRDVGTHRNKGGNGWLGPPRNETAGEKGLAACGKSKRFAVKENVQFGTCKLPENFTGCQDLAKQKKVPFISDDLELECKGKDK
ncbi:hypothetical protein WN943_023383 [Citrus x changshan-huyou]